eukprot:GHVP01030630.1.p1 GENE.GHVP01030630.1~~GHVP01030630.1.p1  ORF type:complete len:657 (+),score=83.39 GHVP01030630.1:618-2588(+)
MVEESQVTVANGTVNDPAIIKIWHTQKNRFCFPCAEFKQYIEIWIYQPYLVDFNLVRYTEDGVTVLNVRAVSVFSRVGSIKFALTLSWISQEMALSHMYKELIHEDGQLRTVTEILESSREAYNNCFRRVLVGYDLPNNNYSMNGTNTKKYALPKSSSRIIAEKYEDNFEMYEKTYTHLYRTTSFPTNTTECNSEGCWHYNGHLPNETIRTGFGMTGFDLADMNPSTLPFYSIVFPEVYSFFLTCLQNLFNEIGWIPEQSFLGNSGRASTEIIGTTSDLVISYALAANTEERKFEFDWDSRELFLAALKGAFTEAPFPYGRQNLKDYLEIGYYPYDSDSTYSVSRTLLSYNADFALASVSSKLGFDNITELLSKRVAGWKKTYDSNTRIFVPTRHSGFKNPTMPYVWDENYWKGGPYTYRTYVIFALDEYLASIAEHNQGAYLFCSELSALMDSNSVGRHTSFSDVPDDLIIFYTNNLGQYFHQNPFQHHLFALFGIVYQGKPYLSEVCRDDGNFLLRSAVDRLYTGGGLSSRECGGSYSSFYLMSMLGLISPPDGTGTFIMMAPAAWNTKIIPYEGKEIIFQNVDYCSTCLSVSKVEVDGQERLIPSTSPGELLNSTIDTTTVTFYRKTPAILIPSNSKQNLISVFFVTFLIILM